MLLLTNSRSVSSPGKVFVQTKVRFTNCEFSFVLCLWERPLYRIQNLCPRGHSMSSTVSRDSSQGTHQRLHSKIIRLKKLLVAQLFKILLRFYITRTLTVVYSTTHYRILPYIQFVLWKIADPSGRAVKGIGLWPLACWDCGFQPHRGMDVCLLWMLCVVR